MARVRQKVNDLIAEDPGMETAIQTVLDRASDGPIEWGDVEDDLTSGQWGRLIEKGVLASADGGGFEVRDPDAIRDALTDDEVDIDAEAPESDSSWTTYDKAAGVGALLMFVGYSYTPLRNVIGTTVDVVLGPLEAVLPFYVMILLLAMVTGLYSTLLQDSLMDTEKIAYYQEKMKSVREREQAAKERDDDEALEEIREEQMEAAGEQLGMFKEQFRPMAWIMLLTIPAFLWMYWMILGGRVPDAEMNIVLPLAGEVNWNDGVGPLPFPAWIVWYFVCSLGFTQVIRKALNVQTTPGST